jgi:hypothetical protein
MNRLARPLVFAVCASSLIDVATDTPSVRGHWLGPFFQLTPATQLTSACCAAALTLFALFMLFEKSEGSGAMPEPTGAAGDGVFSRLLRLLPATSMVYALFWTQPHVDPAFAIPWNAMVVAAPIFIGVSAFRRWPPLWTAGVVAVVGITVRLVHFARFPIDQGADMLPLTQSALASFLAGKNPYVYYDLPGPVPLTYYPLTWLAFLPPYLAHVDLRWTNIVAEMAVLAAIVRAGSGRGKAGANASDGAARFMNAESVAVLVWSFQFLLPSSVYFDRITTAPVAWALISWCVVLLARESAYAWVVLGLTAAGTPLASIIVPFAFVAWWQRQSPREAAVRTLSAGLVAGVILAPFVVWSPHGFIDGAVLWFNDLSRYPGVTWRAYQPWARYMGFVGLFWSEGLERALAPIQWLLVGGVTALFARRRAQADLLASHVAGAFVAFMVFNSVNWPYFYQPAIYGALLIPPRALGGLRA